MRVDKAPGEPLGVEVSSAVFDRIRTCDNHCAFCFIYQLPKGMRRSLYVKDDDYRLSFLYGNFTTLTRFTELDVERILTERLGPLFVSIHATDPEVRAHMLRNPKGATSLRWLRVLLDGGHRGARPDRRLPGRERRRGARGHPGRHPRPVPRARQRRRGAARREPVLQRARDAPAHADEAAASSTPSRSGRGSSAGARPAHGLRRRRVLPPGRTGLPPARQLRGLPQHENGIGMARAFAEAFARPTRRAGRRAPRLLRLRRRGARRGLPGAAPARRTRPATDDRPVTVLTGAYGARCSRPLVAARGTDVELRAVPNDFFGGNIGVAGLLTGADLARALAGVPDGARCLLPDVCLYEGRFLDGLTLSDLPRPVEVVATDGASLRRALDGTSFRPGVRS